MIKIYHAQPHDNLVQIKRTKGILERTSHIIPPTRHTRNHVIQHGMLACGDLADNIHQTCPNPIRTFMGYLFSSSLSWYSDLGNV